MGHIYWQIINLEDLGFWDEFKGQNFGIHMSFVVVDQVLNNPNNKGYIDQMNNPILII
jgi:hypothetical protein